MRLSSCVVALGLMAAAPAMAVEEPSTVSLYGGAYSASNGYSDRQFAGLFADLHTGKLGLHGDFVGVFREADAAYGALGLSYRLTDSVRPKLMIGTSTDNRNILPDLLVNGSVELKPAKGVVVTPSVTYRRYRTGGKETAPGVAVARYFDFAGDHDGYWVAMAEGLISFNSSDRNGYLVRAGLQTVRKSGVSLGLNGEFGRMTYLSVLGGSPSAPPLAANVASRLWSVSPSVGYRFGNKEIFVRAAYIDTQFYTLKSGTLGIKFSF